MFKDAMSYACLSICLMQLVNLLIDFSIIIFSCLLFRSIDSNVSYARWSLVVRNWPQTPQFRWPVLIRPNCQASLHTHMHARTYWMRVYICTIIDHTD